MYKMIVIDDEYLVRKGIKETIDWSQYDIEIVAEAVHGKAGLELVKIHLPDIIITDIRMPMLDGLEFIKQVKAEEISDAMIVVLSGYKDFEYAKEALENGAFSYLLKPIDNQELIGKVQAALQALDRKRATQRLNEQVHQNIHVLHREFLFNVIKGREKNADAIREKSEAYGLKLDEKGIVAHLIIDRNPLDNTSQSSTNIASIMKIIGSTLAKHHINSHQIEHPDYAVTMLIGTQDSKQLESMLDLALTNIMLDEKQTWTIGVSDLYHHLLAIPEAYQQAKSRVIQKPYPMLNAIISTSSNYPLKPQVKACLEHIARHYQDNITVKSVSEVLQISESNLMHAMKKSIGKTFNEYLTDYRMMVAKTLLKSRKYRVYEVANKVGFNDEKYFSQVFKKRENMTPTAYMEMDESNHE